MNTLVQTHSNEQLLWMPRNKTAVKKMSKSVCSFLDTAVSSMGRATHYNTRAEQQAAELRVHDELFGLERDVYAVLLTLPGLTDRSVQIGMKKLLSFPRNGVEQAFLEPGQERMVLYHLFQALPPQRMLKLIDGLRVGDASLGLKKANNARTRKLILRTLLSSPRLQLWSVKYRTKMRAALTHAWGLRLTSIIGSILKKGGRYRKKKELTILEQNIRKHCQLNRYKEVLECVGFILDVRERLSLPLFVSFEKAKEDIKAGSKLPLEVLEGLRSTYHPDTKKEDVLKLVAKGGKLTGHQKMAVQKRAKRANVEVDMDPTKYDAVRLYLYAFECGLTQEIANALDEKAKETAAMFPTRYKSVAVIVDASQSMAGHRSQPLRPLAVALAMRDTLLHTGDESQEYHVSGTDIEAGDGLVRPMGDTAIADSLVEALNDEPEAVFVISDGYENAPAGRFAEVMHHVREIGIDTPVYHLNPVFAAESKGARELAPNDGVPTMPVQQPGQLTATFIRGMIEAEPVNGINALLRLALGSVETRKALS